VNSSNIITGGIYEASSNVSGYFHLSSEVEQLRVQNSYLKKKLTGRRVLIGEEFTSIDDTSYLQQFDFLNAKIISSSKNGRKNSITINKGTENNIRPEMGVVGTKGIIGITTSSSGHYTYVKPLIHEDFILEVVHEKSKSFGFVKWTLSDDWRTATVVDIPNYVEVKPGDEILTRGSNGLFPVGEMVGFVLSVEDIPGEVYLKVKINLAEDFSSVYSVQVIDNVLKKEFEELKNNQN
jgi:rod shape-determining protein MreC|tara:strand:+ start:105 stop:815 length:711 start_codon:yes stop_codon:yes gene_type:complete